MNKAEFLAELRRRLGEQMSGEELADALSYYEEYLEDAGPDGEQAALEALGSADAVAAQVLAGREKSVPPAMRRRSHGGVIALCVVLGLILVAVVIFAVLAFAGYQTALQPPWVTQIPVTVEPVKPITTAVPQVSAAGTAQVESFTKLEVDVGMGRVEIRPGSEFVCSLSNSGTDKNGTPYELHYSVEGDTLRIWSTPDALRTDSTSTPTGDVTITLPVGMELTRAKISIGMGSLDWADCAVSRELDCEIGMGDIDISGPIGGSADLESGMGNVKLNADLGEEEYSYDLETGMGALRLNGKKLHGTETEGGSGPCELDLSSGMGDVELTFG